MERKTAVQQVRHRQTKPLMRNEPVEDKPEDKPEDTPKAKTKK